jgi:hypothetical protein
MSSSRNFAASKFSTKNLNDSSMGRYRPFEGAKPRSLPLRHATLGKLSRVLERRWRVKPSPP